MARRSTSIARARFSTTTDRLDSALGEIDHLICYAVKANSNRAILNLLSREGAGFDIVSGGELFRVLAAGGDPQNCTFAGVGKSQEEIEYALDQRVLSFNVESEAELACIDRIARSKGVQAPIALRVNPDVDAGTHRYVSTGRSENKFGIALDRVAEVYEQAARMPNIAIRGVQMHIGSQITDAAPFAEAIAKVTPLILKLKERFALEFFSVGGGIGIVYESSFASGSGDWWSEKDRVQRDDHSPTHDSRLRCRHPASVARHRAARAARAWPAARRQCRRPPHPRPLPQTSRAQEIRDRRCGNERLDPARALPELPRDCPGPRSARRRARIGGCRRSCLRERRFFCARPAAAGNEGGRSRRAYERRRVRFRHGFELQFPSAPGGGAGAGRTASPLSAAARRWRIWCARNASRK